MKKASLNLIFICLTTLFIFSCKNSSPVDKTKSALTDYKNCLKDCDQKEKVCWDEFDKCKGQAASEEQTALTICSHVPPANQAECKNKAVSDYRDKIEQCERKLRICLGEIRKCRDACGSTKLPDTQ
jgi:hypothetical protein